MNTASPPIPRAVGIDFGDRTLKLAVVDSAFFPPWHQPTKLIAWGSVPVPTGLFDRGLCKDIPAGATLLTRALESAKPKPIRLRAAAFAIPESQAYVRSDLFPAVKPKDLPPLVAERAGKDFPLSLEEASLEYAVARREQGSLLVMYGAVSHEYISNALALARTAGLTPFALEVEASAIARSIEHLIPEHEPQAILDLGATRTSFIIAYHGAIMLTLSLPIGGDAMTARIAEKLNITPEKAESVKRSCGLDPARCEVRVRALITDLLEELIAEIRNGLSVARRTLGPAHHPKAIALVGGGSNSIKLDTLLSKELFIKVRRLNPTLHVVLPDGFPREEGPAYATALGLARLGIPPPSHRLVVPFWQNSRH